MPIYYIDEAPSNSCHKRRLPNGQYRYWGYFHTIAYCIDADTIKTEDEIEQFLNNRSVDYLLDMEKYIMHMK